jgi:hypothetical protein
MTVMSTQIFILSLFTTVSIVRFIKGYITRNREFNFVDEVNGTIAHTVVLGAVFLIVFGVVSIFN